MKSVGLYIHIPFRVYKINHRNVISYYNKDFYIDNYFKALKKELFLRKNDSFLIDSIYFGGGDPSSLNSDYVVDILEYIRENYNVKENCEISVEINPICPDFRLVNYVKFGFNRFSIKVFTFDKKGLQNLAILHDRRNIKDVLKILEKSKISNINLDMYFMYPGQTLKTLKEDLEILNKLKVPHISYYCYQDDHDVEGEKLPVCEEIDHSELKDKMLEAISNTLINFGYNHYEINHFEKNGYKSYHNQKYWNMDEYLAVGIGATGFINNILYKNVTEFEEYFSKIKNEELPILEEEELSSEDLEKNYIISRMGLDEGIDIETINSKFKINFLEKYKKEIRKNIDIDILEIKDNHVKFTNHGKYYSNEFYMDII